MKDLIVFKIMMIQKKEKVYSSKICLKKIFNHPIVKKICQSNGISNNNKYKIIMPIMKNKKILNNKKNQLKV